MKFMEKYTLYEYFKNLENIESYSLSNPRFAY